MEKSSADEVPQEISQQPFDDDDDDDDDVLTYNRDDKFFRTRRPDHHQNLFASSLVIPNCPLSLSVHGRCDFDTFEVQNANESSVELVSIWYGSSLP